MISNKGGWQTVINPAIVAKGLERLGERRAFDRVRCQLAGQLVWSELFTPVACTIVNISEKGAKIQTLRSVSIPSHFTLVVPAEGFSIPVQLIWRAGPTVGLNFVGPPRKL